MIKPVVIFKGVRHNSRTEMWGFLSTPDVAPQENAYLYEIPDTHRVVSVELLRQLAVRSPTAGLTLDKELREIIDNK